MSKHGLIAILALCLSACVTATPYGPASEGGGFGFSDQQIEDNRFRITFRGNSSTRRETVENALLYRAAELALERGYDYFVVVENETEASRSFSTATYPAFYGRYYGPGFGYGSPFYGRRGFGRRGFGYGSGFGRGFGPGFRGGFVGFPYYAYGFGWGVPFDAYTTEITRYSAVAFVLMGNGEKPADNPQAFVAREVVDNLGPVVLETGS